MKGYEVLTGTMGPPDLWFQVLLHHTFPDKRYIRGSMRSCTSLAPATQTWEIQREEEIFPCFRVGLSVTPSLRRALPTSPALPPRLGLGEEPYFDRQIQRRQPHAFSNGDSGPQTHKVVTNQQEGVLLP